VSRSKRVKTNRISLPSKGLKFEVLRPPEPRSKMRIAAPVLWLGTDCLIASCCNSVVVEPDAPRYISPVSRLTKQEQMFLCTVIGLLLVGWAVKTCRTAHPPAVVAQEVIH
jgi:hypothetical protein